MNILWITNIELPDIAHHFGENIVFGGWLDYTSKILSKTNGIKLIVASPGANNYANIQIDGIHYYSFNNNSIETVLSTIISNNNIDLVHIWGSEYKYSYYAYAVAKNNNLADKTVVSIQGLMSEYHYYYYGLPNKIINKSTIFEKIRKKSLKDNYDERKELAKYEILLLKSIKHCIGRTDWDKSCVMKINPTINYHFCNENLRKNFYSNLWNYENCNKHTIFVSQASYPIKGLHNLLVELPLIIKKYPDTKVYIAGKNEKYTRKNIIKNLILDGTYVKYIKKLIRKNKLSKCIEWQGVLKEDEMINTYKKSNVALCSSTIENSSNSVCEAMMLGMPVVAAAVGGLTTIINNGVDGILYEPYIKGTLANAIISVFEDSNYAIKLGQNARKTALERHDIDKNTKQLLSIYNDVLDVNSKQKIFY